MTREPSILDFVQPQVAGYRSCRWWLDATNMWNSNGVAPLKSKGAQGGPGLCTPFPFPGVPTRGRSY